MWWTQFGEPRRVDLISYEMYVLDTLQDQVRSKEVWIERAGRCLSPTTPLSASNGL